MSLHIFGIDLSFDAPWAFVQLHPGFRDWLAGFTIARFAAHNSFLKHLMLWELQNDSKSDKNT